MLPLNAVEQLPSTENHRNEDPEDRSHHIDIRSEDCNRTDLTRLLATVSRAHAQSAKADHQLACELAKYTAASRHG